MADNLPLLGKSYGLTPGQVAQLIQLVGLSLLNSKEFNRVPTVELDKFIKVASLGLVETYVKLAEQMLQASVGYHIWVDYGLENAIEIAIKQNNFGSKSIDINWTEFLPLGGGKVLEQVHEVPFGKDILNGNLQAVLKQEGIRRGFQFGFKPCNPLAALLFALEFPTKQLEKQLGISFYDNGGRLWYLCLYQLAGKPRLRVGLDNRMAWRKEVVFLAVVETEPATV